MLNDINESILFKSDQDENETTNQTQTKKQTSKDRKIELDRKNYELINSELFDEEVKDIFFRGICQNLKREMDQHGYTYQQLAELSNVSSTSVFRIVHGDVRISLNSLYNLALVLGKNPADFLPSVKTTRQTNGQIYDEITKELDVTSNNILLENVATWVKEWRRLKTAFTNRR